MFLKTETSMIVGWFTVVYAVFRFSQEKVLHLPWAIRVTFCKYLKKFFFFKSLTQSFCIFKEHKRTQFGSTLQADVTDLLLKFSFGGLRFPQQVKEGCFNQRDPEISLSVFLSFPRIPGGVLWLTPIPLQLPHFDNLHFILDQSNGNCKLAHLL